MSRENYRVLEMSDSEGCPCVRAQDGLSLRVTYTCPSRREHSNFQSRSKSISTFVTLLRSFFLPSSSLPFSLSHLLLFSLCSPLRTTAMIKVLEQRALDYIKSAQKPSLFDFLVNDVPNLVQEHVTFNDVTHGDVVTAYQNAAKRSKRKYLLGEPKKNIFPKISTAFEQLKASKQGASGAVIIADQVQIGNNNTLSQTVLKRKDREEEEEVCTGPCTACCLNLSPDLYTNVFHPKAANDQIAEDINVKNKRQSFTIPTCKVAGLTPCKPKLALPHLEMLGKNANIATSFAITGSHQDALPRRLVEEFQACKEAGRQRQALAKYPAVSAHLRHMLRQLDDWDRWDDLAYQLSPMSLGPEEGHFWRTLRYGLVAMHGVLAPIAASHVDNHERTATVDLVIPWLGPLRLLGTVSWKWCEFGLTAKKMAKAAEAGRFADGLALERANGAEIIFLESSGGLLRENVEHNMDDNVKLIESACFAMKEFMSKHKDADFYTIKKRAVYTFQLVRNVVTLSRVGLAPDGTHWDVVELRSTVLPTSWDNAGAAMGVAELLATIYQELKVQKEVQRRANDEINGLSTPVPLERTVRHCLNWLLR
ncbi:hypothetical protein DFS34DRAFT_414855 [Phlyctochytrium arcticum]|nr:hypothetical protein DFS34DRAFT_414855 [Phlyctochytrium arcticum]